MATLYGTAAADTLLGTLGDDSIYGYAGNDILYGAGSGADYFDGGLGADIMIGGAGNDAYIVDDASDKVIEAGSSGVDTVYSYVSRVLETNVENLYLWGTALNGYGNALNNSIYGNSSDNHLYAYDGNDYLNGGAGNDHMIGGLGNDTYVIDSAGDSVSEAAASGTDTIYAYVSDTLDTNVEIMYLYGTATNGYGNALDNNIYGNSNNNYINGSTGNDYMAGGLGNDTYVIDSAGDSVYEASESGTDTVYAYVSDTLDANVEIMRLYGTATNGYGNALNNSIYGNGYNNYINGGTGNDYMSGGLGNDTYVIDSAGDSVYEAASAGTDTVYAYVSDTLDANVENLYLYGAATNGYGNALNNSIYGNSYNNYINGSTGNDYMAGGLGNDTYIIDSAGDSVYEAAAAGTDTVYSYVSDTLDTNVENLYLYGTAISGYGNALNNRIYGNTSNNTLMGNDGADYLSASAGNDALLGGNGKDTLYGGTGSDSFYFAESGSLNADTIGDFSHVDDSIILRDLLDGVVNSAINGLSFSAGVLNTSWYFEGAGKTGNGTELSGIYNDTNSGSIYYNPTSGTSGDSVLIAIVGSTVAASLDNTDFLYG